MTTRKSTTARRLFPDSATPRNRNLVLVVLLLVGFAGCQASQWSQASLPVPPAAIDLAQVRRELATARSPIVAQTSDAPAGRSNAVRFQGPDDDRIRSLNEFSYDAIAKAQGQVAKAEQLPQTDRVAEVIIQGNQRMGEEDIRKEMRTRAGRFFDPDKLQQDVNHLWRMKDISRINGPYIEHTPNGMVVTLDVVETESIAEVKFVGNRGISDNKLKTETGIEDGQPLDVHQIRLARNKIEEFYHRKGYPRTQVEILEGADPADQRVVFLIHEDEQQRVWKVEFEGNTIASDGRLKSFIKSKPGVLKLIGGLVKRNEIDQDITRLTTYYRSLGFFNARVGREISESNDGRWLNLRFIINEGPRYRVRQVSFIGNQAFRPDQMLSLIELKPSDVQTPEFNVAKMNADVVSLRDLYGGQGFIHASVVAEPRFLEEPGLLDIVYKIEEGKQYYAGNINVHYVGGGAITRRDVVINRVSVRPGDLIDVRKIRNSERRLNAANVFANGQEGGAAPRIVVATPENQDVVRAARRSARTASGSSSRSSSPPSAGSGSRSAGSGAR